LILGVASLVVLGCDQSEETGSSCAATVRWNQTLYIGHTMKAPLGGALGRVSYPLVPPVKTNR
jgi:hypothetical protein